MFFESTEQQHSAKRRRNIEVKPKPHALQITEVADGEVRSMIRELKIVADQDKAGVKAANMAAETTAPLLSLEDTLDGLKQMKEGVGVESAFAHGDFRLPSPKDRESTAVNILLPSEHAHAAAFASGKDVVQHQLEEGERLSNLLQISQHLVGDSIPSPTNENTKSMNPIIQELKGAKTIPTDDSDEEYADDFEDDEDEEDERVHIQNSRDHYKVALIVAYFLYSEGSITKIEQGKLKNLILMDDSRVQSAVDEFALTNDANVLQDAMHALAQE